MLMIMSSISKWMLINHTVFFFLFCFSVTIMYFHWWCSSFSSSGSKLNLDKLEKIIWDRFRVYTTQINLQSDTENCNTYNEMAHLILSLIAVDYPDLRDSFIKGEVKIFMEKIETEDLFKAKGEIMNLFTALNNISKNAEQYNLTKEEKDYLMLPLNILETFLNNESHLLTSDHSATCDKLTLIVPFTFPLKLVAKREVEVHRGLVSLPCSKWFKLIEIVYENFLKLEMIILKKSEEIKKIVYNSEDDRMRQIIQRFVTSSFGNIVEESADLLKIEEVDLSSRYFPPCMANLHQILRQKHRLSYDSRYQYTLFLKDIGLPLEDNILFWENEYSKPYEGSSCTHAWLEKKKRYIYQIQHMYGLLGAHERKTCHSCDKFVNDLRIKMDGGCPFQHFTVEKLKSTIPEKLLKLPDIEDLFRYKDCGMPQKACAIYLMCQNKVFKKSGLYEDSNFRMSKLNYVVSPVQYYRIAKKSIEY